MELAAGFERLRDRPAEDRDAEDDAEDDGECVADGDVDRPNVSPAEGWPGAGVTALLEVVAGWSFPGLILRRKKPRSVRGVEEVFTCTAYRLIP